ncbi:MAG: substrate-binding domain-containing protein, partial [Acidobacteriota bacterium]
DVALAGFDDIPIARFMMPPLTSVRVSIAELGGLALERLLHAVAMENRQPKRQEKLSATLVVRRSCGAGGLTESRARIENGFDIPERRMTV